MGILPRLLAATPAPSDDFWYNPVTNVSSAGITITPERALTISAVYACVRVLAETVAQLPLILYRRLENGGKERATDHPLYRVLHDRPNQRQTSFQFREMLMGHLALRGNGYAQIIPGVDSFADQLIPLHPDRMLPEVTAEGIIRYRYSMPEGRIRFFSQDQIFHLTTLSDDGLVGLSLITLARDSFGLGKATEEYGTRFFSQGARPRGLLTHPGKLKPEAIANLKESLRTEFAGTASSHGTLVLEEGMDWKNLGLTNEDSQFLGTREFSVTEVARWFRIPPHMIGDLTRSTFSNIENESLNFVRFTMAPWFVRWEQAILKDLLLEEDSEEYFAEFLMDAFLRGDTLARAQSNQIYVQLGVFTRNEVRVTENRNPLPGLDEPLTPANITGAQPVQKTEPKPSEPPANRRNGQAHALALDVAARVVRKEQLAMSKAAKRYAADQEGFDAKAQEFYAEHAGWVARVLKISDVDAERYCEEQQADIKNSGIKALEDWLPARAEVLVDIMEGNPSMEEKPKREEPPPAPSRLVLELQSPQPKQFRKLIERAGKVYSDDGYDEKAPISGVREVLIPEPEPKKKA